MEMDIRDIEPVNPRLTEKRSGFLKKVENQKKVSPSICYSCCVISIHFILLK